MRKPYSYRLTRVNYFAPELIGTAVSHGVFDYYLLDETIGEFSCEHRDCGGLILDELTIEFGQWMRGQIRPDRFCISFFKQLEQPCWINGMVVGTGDLQLYAERAELACRIYPGTRCAFVQVSRSAIEAAARRCLGAPVWLPAQGIANLQPGAESRLKIDEAFDRCGRLLEQGGDAVEQGVELLLQSLVLAIRGADLSKVKQEDRRSQQALQMVRLAELYLAAHLAEGYSSVEFARAIGMSERSLELQFKKMFGMSPKRWRQYMGLNIAHRKLWKGPDRPGLVAEVASACGFSHPGRFSAIYRRLFGELPVRTRGHERAAIDQQEAIFRSFVH